MAPTLLSEFFGFQAIVILHELYGRCTLSKFVGKDCPKGLQRNTEFSHVHTGRRRLHMHMMCTEGISFVRAYQTSSLKCRCAIFRYSFLRRKRQLLVVSYVFKTSTAQCSKLNARHPMVLRNTPMPPCEAWRLPKLSSIVKFTEFQALPHHVSLSFLFDCGGPPPH